MWAGFESLIVYQLEKGYFENEISLDFRTTVGEGLLLFTGTDPNLSVASSDYLAIYLVGGSVVFSFQAGTRWLAAIAACSYTPWVHCPRALANDMLGLPVPGHATGSSPFAVSYAHMHAYTHICT